MLLASCFLLLASCLIPLKGQIPLCYHPCDIELPFISSAMDCSPSDCPDCRFIIDYKYREGWCDYDGNDTLEYIREIYLSNFQVQNCPSSCWENRLNTDAGLGKYRFSLYCLLKNHQWDTNMLKDITTLCGGDKFFVYVRNHRCGKETLYYPSKNFTFCYNNQCCTWKYKLRFTEIGDIPYTLSDFDNGYGAIYALKLDSLECGKTFQCPNIDSCRLCYCDFSLNNVTPPFQPKTNINEFRIQENKQIIVTTKNNSINILLLNKETFNIQLELYNVIGDKIFDKIMDGKANEELYQIDLPNMINGIYFIRITQDKRNIYFSKLIIYK